MQRGVAVIATAPEHLRNRDAHYPYRFDSYFYYLTGFTEPEAVLVLIAGDTPRSLLFCRDKDLEREIWDGFRYGPEGAKQAFGFDDAHSIKQLDEMLPKLLADQPAIFSDVGENGAWDARLIQWLNAVRAQVRTGISAPGEIRDVRKLLDDMRLIKDSQELDVMRRAAKISAGAHRRAMRSARPGLHEYEVEAELLHEFRAQRCAGARLHAHRRRWRQRLRAALRRQRSAAQGRRPAADRRRLRAGRLCRRHHPHIPGQRTLRGPAERRVRAGAGRAGRGHRASEAGQSTGSCRTRRR